MADVITDSNGGALGYVNQTLAEGTQSAVLAFLVPCAAGRYLTAADDAGVRVLARRTGSGEAFVDLANAPYDLTPYDGQTISFDFKLSAGAVMQNSTFAVPVTVTPNP